nr:tripartite tricarboxylate transporter TctB family protein [uncultured Cohaesibacter sp.]
MGIMKTAEIAFLAILAAFAASLAIGSLDLKYADEFSFGPGFIPLNVGVLILICCALQVIRGILKHRKANTRGNAATEQHPPNIAGLLITTAILVLGIAAMAFGSVLAPIFAMIVLLSWRVANHPITNSLFVGAATTAAIYVIFAVWLNLPVL